MSTVPAEDTKLKKLIKEIRESVEKAKGFWTQLPYGLCEDDSVGTGPSKFIEPEIYLSLFHNSDRFWFFRLGSSSIRNIATSVGNMQNSNCWNGKDAGSYDSSVVNDGLVNQDRNPEVKVDISRPDIDINEQIFALKIMTKRLENAYNGQPVEWPNSRGEWGCNPSSAYEWSPDWFNPSLFILFKHNPLTIW